MAHASRTARMSLLLAMAGVLAACHATHEEGPGTFVPALTVSPTALQTRAQSGPPADASKGTSLGQGAVTIKTANSASDADSVWVEQIDIDGDGDADPCQLLWDDEAKALFAYAETEALCDFGGTALVQILAGVNGAGNARRQAAGSGFYAVYLEALECNAETAGVWGCTFGADGVVSEWAAAAVDTAGNGIIFAAERP